ncbi:uncharacterized protein LOC111059188 isoform X2 [Nilaparvata lugens]|nr:uncharacterized protein LOC111059188 isoform X2 [Nilaparvata lugens]
MKSGGSFAIILVVPGDPTNNIGVLDGYCKDEFPQFKCYYGVEDAHEHNPSSFNVHFNNPYDGAISFYKDGVQKSWVSPKGVGKSTTVEQIRAGFNKAK